MRTAWPSMSRLGVAVVIDVDASNEGDQLAVLGAFMGSLGVYRLSDQVDRHWIIPHLRCAIIPHPTSRSKNFPASEMRDNPSPTCRPWTTQSACPCSNEARRVSGRPMARFLTEKPFIPISPKWTASPCDDATWRMGCTGTRCGSRRRPAAGDSGHASTATD